jgi:hypothetical protein
MNHKRGKPKSARSGCLMCKWWKIEGNSHLRRPAKEQGRRDAMKVEARA